MSDLVERVIAAGAKDAWSKPMITDSEARAIIHEIADWAEAQMEDHCWRMEDESAAPYVMMFDALRNEASEDQ